MPPQLSVVSPVYRAEGCLEELHERLTSILGAMNLEYEIILVDDGSPDGSAAILSRLASSDPHVTAMLLSRNFGQQAAILAGLAEATGDAIVVMDCDLQDRPEDIPLLYAKLEEGFDVAVARRRVRRHSWFKRATSRLWFGIINRLSDLPADPDTGSFSVIRRNVADQLLSMPNRHSHYMMILRWIGFRQAYVDVEHAERHEGRSSYSLSKLVAHAMAGITAHSTRLLHLSIYAGFSFFVLACIQVVYIIFVKLAHGVGVPGWASVMAVLWFLGGALLFSLGVIGIYIARIVEDVKQRPTYIVRQRIRRDAK